jgi:6-phosphogluconate dehydrogenase
MNNTSIIVLGMGRMGSQVAKRLHVNTFTVLGWNRSEAPVLEVEKSGVIASTNLDELIQKMTGQRIFWIMLPQGIVDAFLQETLASYLKAGDIVVDGGNSFYKDSMRRGDELAQKGILFCDCGTSGGIHGEKNGFSLMVGGPKEAWSHIEPAIKALSAGDNYAYLGKTGAGHFTKMVHNGIEYGMMEAIAEGYAVLEASPFTLNLSDVTRTYQTGSVVRSWLIDLCKEIFDHDDIAHTAGIIDATGEGEWTVNAGKEFGVDVRVIEDSYRVRQESQKLENQEKFSNKIVALMRNHFGGHRTHTK